MGTARQSNSGIGNTSHRNVGYQIRADIELLCVWINEKEKELMVTLASDIQRWHNIVDIYLMETNLSSSLGSVKYSPLTDATKWVSLRKR